MGDLTEQKIRTYTIGEVIGRGGAATVYRAHQEIIEREVAIKVIHAEFANIPQFVRQFNLEAQIVARLEHPHIVPLYDYWREPNNAFLVMRYLRGGSLLNVLKNQPSIKEAARLFDQIARALAVAHQASVIHQDIKPGNILLDENDNAYLSDFGIARDLSVSPEEHQIRRGTLAYMAPEQFMSSEKEITHHVDIYSMGVILYELIAGERAFKPASETDLIRAKVHGKVPSVSSARPDLPPGIDEIIQKATHKVPSERHNTIIELSDAFQEYVAGSSALQTPNRPISASRPPRSEAVLDESTPQQIIEPVNPFLGLRAFQEGDARFFFGREQVTKQLIYRLAQYEPDYRFLAVVGPSGSGKSSVVKAGVIPALRAGAVPGSRDWFIVEMVPGTQPIMALQTALLGIALQQQDNLLDTLQAGEDGLRRALSAMLPEKNETLIVIDQFEEVFTRVEDEQQRLLFIQMLIRAVTAPDSHLRIIITLRADFYDRPLFYGDLGEIMKKRTETVLPMNRDELMSTITGPAERAGLQVEPALVDALVSDVLHQPGALPLMQYTLSELYTLRVHDTLTLEAYRKAGGIQGSLTNRAGELITALSKDRRELARQIFLRLVTVEDGAEATRRRIPLLELHSMQRVDRKTLTGILERFSKYRLLTLGLDPNLGPTVEIAHEALIRHWDDFTRWLEESRSDLRTQRRLNAAAEEWHQAKRASSYLADKERLVQFQPLLEGQRVILNTLEADFLEASIARARRQQRVRQAQIITIMAVALAMTGLALFALLESTRANQETDRANSEAIVSRARELSANARLNDSQPDLALLLSIESDAIASTFETRSNLLTLLQQFERLAGRLHGQPEWVRALALSPDGQTLAAVGRSNQLTLWRVSDGQLRQSLTTTHTDWVNALAYSPDGRQIVTGGRDDRVLIWNVADGSLAGELAQHTDEVWSVAYSPDGKLLATGGLDGNVFLWDTATGQLLPGTTASSTSGPVTSLLRHDGGVFTIAFSHNGRSLATGGADQQVRVWRILADGTVFTGSSIVSDAAAHQNRVLRLVYSPDDRYLASADEDGRVWLWQFGLSETQLTRLNGHLNSVRGLAFNADSTLLATGDTGGQIRLWDVTRGSNTAIFNTTDSSEVWSLVFGQTGRLFSGGTENSVSAWYTGRQRSLWQELQAQGALVLHLLPQPGSMLSISGDTAGANDLRVWSDDGSQRQLTTAAMTAASISGAALSADGQRLWVADTASLRLYDTATDTLLTTETIPAGDTLSALALSPDGAWLAAGTAGGRVLFWQRGEADYTRLEALPARHADRVLALAFSPDGRHLASASRDGTWQLWDAATQQPVGAALTAHPGGINALAFSPDSARLATGGRDSRITLWDIATQQPLPPALTGHRDRVTALAFSPDGRLLASGGLDNAVILWDSSVGRMLANPLITHQNQVSALAFAPDGQRLYSGDIAGRLLLWQVGLPSWLARACQVAGRSLSVDEWSSYLPDMPYMPHCDPAEGNITP